MGTGGRSGSALPGKCAPREGSGKDPEVSGLNIRPFVRSKAAETGATAPPPPRPRRLSGASVSRGPAVRTPTRRLHRAPRPPRDGSGPRGLGPSPLPCRRRRRCRCRCAESARSPPAGSGGTDQSRGSWRAPVPPASLPGKGGGVLRGPHGEWEPRPAPRCPGGHNRPTPRCGRRAAPLTPPPPSRPRTTTLGLPVPAPAARRRAEPGHTHKERRTLAATRSG